ncbi:hypothetical protein SEA_HONK_30 [Microbacterium phage Honk]|uniref:Uncharacterized protein n=1 Tax=Microbacterium phage Honk TaxID=2836095 RepID=A0A8F3E8A8_9CAUD|nr:hypothetical protein SEA_HONK_30 [Microbacterium phage Honk]
MTPPSRGGAFSRIPRAASLPQALAVIRGPRPPRPQASA